MRAFRALASLALLPGLAEAQGAPGHACTHALKRAHNISPARAQALNHGGTSGWPLQMGSAMSWQRS